MKCKGILRYNFCSIFWLFCVSCNLGTTKILLVSNLDGMQKQLNGAKKKPREKALNRLIIGEVWLLTRWRSRYEQFKLRTRVYFIYKLSKFESISPGGFANDWTRWQASPCRIGFSWKFLSRYETCWNRLISIITIMIRIIMRII